MSDEDQRRTLTRAWSSTRALRGLDGLVARAPPRLEFDAAGLQRADAFTGAVVREGIDRHLAADPGHTVILHEPRHPEALALLHDLVGTLPRRARWAGEQTAPRRDRCALLPATRIDDRETIELLTFALRVAAGPRRLPPSESRLLYQAAKHLAHNDLVHRPRGAAAGLLCACHDRQSHALQVVSLSPSMLADAIEDPHAFLRRMADSCDDALSGLGSLCAQANGGRLDGTLRVHAGRARLYARHGKRRVEVTQTTMKGFAASFEVHLPG